jgi:hypothetical protein
MRLSASHSVIDVSSVLFTALGGRTGATHHVSHPGRSWRGLNSTVVPRRVAGGEADEPRTRSSTRRHAVVTAMSRADGDDPERRIAGEERLVGHARPTHEEGAVQG